MKCLLILGLWSLSTVVTLGLDERPQEEPWCEAPGFSPAAKLDNDNLYDYSGKEKQSDEGSGKVHEYVGRDTQTKESTRTTPLQPKEAQTQRLQFTRPTRETPPSPGDRNFPASLVEGCMECPKEPPTCPACKANERCFVSHRTCQHCPRAYCVAMDDGGIDTTVGAEDTPIGPTRPQLAINQDGKWVVQNPDSSMANGEDRANENCILCPLMVPTCDCDADTEQCVIIPQSCLECSRAVCLPRLFPRSVPNLGVLGAQAKAGRTGTKRPASTAKLTPYSHVSTTTSQGVCVPCPREIPVCPQCAEDEVCIVTEQNCFSCQQAICVKNKEREKQVILTGVSPLLAQRECVKCIWEPTCDNVKCPAGHQCILVPGDCKHCAKVQCLPKQGGGSQKVVSSKDDLSDGPALHQNTPRALPLDVHPIVNVNDDVGVDDVNDDLEVQKDESGTCVNCLWNPTCDDFTCPPGTKCHYTPQSCHSCAQVTCLKEEDL